MIYGAIIGDIVGSKYEFNNLRSKEFEFWNDDNFFTDDTLMTIAVAEALAMMNGKVKDKHMLLQGAVVGAMKSIGQRYPRAGWGGQFGAWLFSDNDEPYNSFGNGAAMRVSAAGWYGKTESEVIKLSEAVTAVTHNHPEGIKGAEAVATLIHVALKGADKESMKYQAITYYDMDFTLDEIRDTYQFNETCQNTVPQAIKAFLESTSFEDAIRNAISIGGDSDTLAAITGSIAEAYYGVPMHLKVQARGYLDEYLLHLVDLIDPICEKR